MLEKSVFRKSLVIGIILLFIGTSITITLNILVRNVKAEPVVIFSDDFEDGTLNKWNVVSGGSDWEIISDNGNNMAHLKMDITPPYRRIVSINSMEQNIIITVELKGNSDHPTPGIADMSFGFYSDSEANNYYIVALGYNDILHIAKYENGIEEVLANNPSIISTENIWYNLKIKLYNNNIFAKRWETGTEEPNDWQISHSGATPFGNHILLGGANLEDHEEIWYDNIEVEVINIIFVPDDYPTIQAAVNAAITGNTIIVRDGTYIENININKQLILKSENGSTLTTIQANNLDDHVFEVISANFVEIQGFTIEGAIGTSKGGICLNTAQYCNIFNNSINSNFYGIYLMGSSRAKIIGNDILSNYRCGIRAQYKWNGRLKVSSHLEIMDNNISFNGNGFSSFSSSQNNIKNNIFHMNGNGIYIERVHYGSSHNYITDNKILKSGGYGIFLDSSQCTITDNIFENCGLHLHFPSTPYTILNNNVNGKPLVYLESEKDYQVSIAGQVILVKCENITVKNLDLTDTSTGIALWYTKNSTIQENTIKSNEHGGGLALRTGFGILLVESYNNCILNNYLYENYKGLYLYSSGKNRIWNNNFEKNKEGIVASYLGNNFIYLNNFINNIYYHTWVDIGAYNFFNSTSQMTYSYNSINYFNYLGNYWDDYSGVDDNHDGIGDTSYNIKTGNIDVYPLIEPFENYIIEAEEPTEFWVEVNIPSGAYICGDLEQKKSYRDIPLNFIFDRNISEGDSGEDVKYLQMLLNSNPLTQVSFEGPGSIEQETQYFGLKTNVSIQKFQSLNGLPITGKVNDSEKVELNKLLQILKYSPLKLIPKNWVVKGKTENGQIIEDSPDGIRWFYKVEDVTDSTIGWVERGDLYYNIDKQSDWSDRTKPIIRGIIFHPIIPPNFSFENNYNYGDDNEEIKYLQLILKEEVGNPTYPSNINATGFYGGITQSAVMEFQKKFDLIQTGNLDQQTRKFLNESLINKTYLIQPCRAIIIRDIILEYISDFLPLGFPPDLVMAMALCESKNVFFDNKVIALTPWGRGIMQIDKPNYYVGMGSGIRWFIDGLPDFCRCGSEQCDCTPPEKTTYCQCDACKHYYTNTIQGIEANIKDGLANLRDKYNYNKTEYHYNQCISGEEGWDECKKYDISCEEMRQISAVQRYNGYNYGNPSDYLAKYDNGNLIGGIAYSLKHLEENFNYPNNTILASKIEKVKIKGINIFSPCNIQIIDSEGRICGLLNNEVKEEIPNSIYDNIYESAMVLFPIDEYNYKIVGTSDGIYNITIALFENGEIFAFNGCYIPTLQGTIHQYTIDWTTLSEGEEGVSIQIDVDGDGTFERTITSDEELTQDEFILQTETTIDIDPDTLNINSTGTWITCYIELPDDYDVEDINISSIILNETVPAEPKPINISDYDEDGITDLMVKFNRQDVIDILEPGDDVEIKISGELLDGTKFEGIDYIKVI